MTIYRNPSLVRSLAYDPSLIRIQLQIKDSFKAALKENLDV
jgi:hypothetical protein